MLYRILLSAAELEKLELIMYPEYCPIHRHFIHIYKKLGLRLPTIFEVDYSESTIAFVANSDFLTILPKSLALTKMTNDTLNLTMKELDYSFTRSVSIFSNKTFPISDFINRLNNIAKT
ncbi:transcriptional regulator [Streptococcus macacae NCTC 11558]|uniref:LysR substrate binding domain protein n=2 Tax=Streptococcus macacae TaxID=1339 RepID=G5JW47_9STRE|nr:LysR substrate binding domain protein [Streptococcus macacae NCTC 11558]SUN79382.1 transcriptional regulator [Streptococcus macacae NCTC 11558]